jgi:hypothetical protein
MRGASEGKCQLCGKKTEIPIGTRQCESCGHEYDQVCSSCLGSQCRKCRQGILKRPQEVFPNSLFKAAREGEVEDVVRLLRDRKAEPDSLFDRNQYSLLSVAAVGSGTQAAFSLCERLLTLGFSANVRDRDTGRTPLMNLVIFRKFRRDVMSLFRTSINDQDKSGRTALMFAAGGAGLTGNPKGHAGIARQLLEMGADVSMVDNRGFTALGRAMTSGKDDKNEDMVDLLRNEMVQQAALRELNKRFTYSITKTGALELKSSSRARSSKSRR